MKLSIGIKALNEERHIGEALASALAAVAPFDGEVILADSGSTDRTVEIAAALPVRIFQLAHLEDRCCGAGAQLAFQHATGEYFYLMDGDMVLKPGFIEAALAFLEQNPDYAAVGGRVTEMNTESAEFQIRARAAQSGRNLLPGEVEQLDGGGLYRAEAVRQAGYFADRNLHGFEEFELGARLRTGGWKLARIDRPAFDHYGHQIGGYRLMWRRMRSGYSDAPGEVLRGALGKDHLGVVLKRLGHVRLGVAVGGWWLLLLAALIVHSQLAWKVGLFALLLLAPLAFLTMRRGSLRLGLYSLAGWNANAIGLVRGFLRRRDDPATPLPSRRLSDA